MNAGMNAAADAIVKVDREGQLWTFTLNRPEKMNALSAAMVEALLAGIAEAHTAGADLLIFRGAGRNFSAGFDFSDADTQSEGDLLLRFVRIEMLLHAVASSPCATLALAHGKNFGAGVDLFAACRQRVCTADVSFRMPGLKFGLVLGTRRFGDLVGRQTARRILEEAQTFGAQRAAEIGFVDTSAPAEAWPEIIAAASARAAILNPAVRAQLHSVLDGESRAAVDADLAALVRSAAKPGLKERVTAYLQGRREVP